MILYLLGIVSHGIYTGFVRHHQDVVVTCHQLLYLHIHLTESLDHEVHHTNYKRYSSWEDAWACNPDDQARLGCYLPNRTGVQHG